MLPFQKSLYSQTITLRILYPYVIERAQLCPFIYKVLVMVRHFQQLKMIETPTLLNIHKPQGKQVHYTKNLGNVHVATSAIAR